MSEHDRPGSPAPAVGASPAPRHAATVILLRESQGGPEVLVVRRHENLAFMGGMWVFPGGTLADADSAERALARIPDGARARCAQFRDLQGAALAPRLCLGLTVAACRETFEETGVLLAADRDGNTCSPELAARLQTERTDIVSQPERFAAILEREHLLLTSGQLAYWAHWITPGGGGRTRRYDTRFFVAAVPPGQIAAIDTTETVEHAWMRPAAVIEAARGQGMPITPPTLFNLIELDTTLRRLGSLSALLHQAQQRTIVPVLPKVIREGSSRTIVMPWDPEYARLPGAGVPDGITYPANLRALPPRV